MTYVEYVSEATNHPNYEAALEAAKVHKVILMVAKKGLVKDEALFL